MPLPIDSGRLEPLTVPDTVRPWTRTLANQIGSSGAQLPVAHTVEEFLALLRHILQQSGCPASKVALKAGLPRSTAYHFVSQKNTVLPKYERQVRMFATGCGLSPEQIDQVCRNWLALDEAESDTPDPEVLGPDLNTSARHIQTGSGSVQVIVTGDVTGSVNVVNVNNVSHVNNYTAVGTDHVSPQDQYLRDYMHDRKYWDNNAPVNRDDRHARVRWETHTATEGSDVFECGAVIGSLALLMIVVTRASSIMGNLHVWILVLFALISWRYSATILHEVAPKDAPSTQRIWGSGLVAAALVIVCGYGINSDSRDHLAPCLVGLLIFPLLWTALAFSGRRNLAWFFEDDAGQKTAMGAIICGYIGWLVVRGAGLGVHAAAVLAVAAVAAILCVPLTTKREIRRPIPIPLMDW
ncbi:hypothetical protein KHQ06_25370 [Nocardia tengchongensis]|uniref:Uncharacterized protein n=1 Tax=Nocardia tengchongensis TaxID=2055889 RepID=A0ABX8CLB0_9NOCA|nr:hypothetical protein [Nocardia tengchongensis]QVI19673.1 hypothetical protein KHQ06_25370 [Nocardia tengchongensis]